jgi:hypothetical protein
MRSDDLQLLYKCLRRELDAAYAAWPRDGTRLERIAEDLWSLVRTHTGIQGLVDARPVGAWRGAASAFFPTPAARADRAAGAQH